VKSEFPKLSPKQRSTVVPDNGQFDGSIEVIMAVSNVNKLTLVPTCAESETEAKVEPAAIVSLMYGASPWKHLRVVGEDQVLVAHGTLASPVDGVKSKAPKFRPENTNDRTLPPVTAPFAGDTWETTGASNEKRPRCVPIATFTVTEAERDCAPDIVETAGTVHISREFEVHMLHRQ